MVGAIASLAGIVVMFADQLTGSVGLQAMLALIASAACVATATVIVKRIRGSHPITTNPIAMLPGVELLLALSLLVGEPRVFPERADTRLEPK